jgi:hypothetical protein
MMLLLEKSMKFSILPKILYDKGKGIHIDWLFFYVYLGLV